MGEGTLKGVGRTQCRERGEEGRQLSEEMGSMRGWFSGGPVEFSVGERWGSVKGAERPPVSGAPETRCGQGKSLWHSSIFILEETAHTGTRQGREKGMAWEG